MATVSYGVIAKQEVRTDRERRLEELSINGFTVIENLISAEVLAEARVRLDRALAKQEKDFGLDRLTLIGEENLVRCPLADDDFFLQFAINETIVDLAHGAIGGGYVILHLQNGIVNKPAIKHHQSNWHRDLPYQEFTSSKPLAIGALLCIDPFTVETGCTHVLPHSHHVERFPSEEYVNRFQVPAEAPPGSVIVFDAMLFHRAGMNSSGQVRRGINHVYSTPIIRQQIDLPAQMKERIADSAEMRKLFGFECITPGSVIEFREARLKKVRAK